MGHNMDINENEHLQYIFNDYKSGIEHGILVANLTYELAKRLKLDDGTALRRSPRGTSCTRGVCAGCSKACIPPICGSVGTERRRNNEGSAHKDAPRASAPAIKGRQQRAHRPRRAVHSDLAGHVHPGAKRTGSKV